MIFFKNLVDQGVGEVVAMIVKCMMILIYSFDEIQILFSYMATKVYFLFICND